MRLTGKWRLRNSVIHKVAASTKMARPSAKKKTCNERATSSQLPAKRSTTATSTISKTIMASPAKPDTSTPTSRPVKMVAAASSMLPPTMIASARPGMV